MAVTRTVLPRKGFIQSQHGLVNYEADQDANMALLDANVAFMADLWGPDLGINGVLSGFALSTSANLTPGLTNGVLYAQGKKYAPPSAPTPPAAPPNTTNYLFYNFTTGFYYQASAVAAATGDALIGQVVTSGTAVTTVTPGTKIYGQLSAAPSAAGNFTLQHFLGRTPVGAVIQMTSGGAIWFQTPNFDPTNIYLVASGIGVTAKVQVW